MPKLGMLLPALWCCLSRAVVSGQYLATGGLSRADDSQGPWRAVYCRALGVNFQAIMTKVVLHGGMGYEERQSTADKFTKISIDRSAAARVDKPKGGLIWPSRKQSSVIGIHLGTL